MAQVPQPNQELAVAHACAERGDFDQAFHHLEIAALQGVNPGRIARERVWIESIQRSHDRARAEHLALVVAIPFLGYLFLSVAEPPAYGTVVWAGLAFLLVPVVSGFALSRVLAGFTRTALFLRGFGIVGGAMACYTVFNIVLTRTRIAEAIDPGALFMIGGTVVLAFAIGAGLVAGVFSMVFARKVSA
jgi:hypothetical protein